MFDNLDDPNPASVTAADLTGVHARAREIRRARQHTAAAVGSSAFAMVAVVGVATLMSTRHGTPGAKPGVAPSSETSPAPVTSGSPSSTASPQVDWNTSPTTGPTLTASPSENWTPSASAESSPCMDAYRTLIPSYLPAGLTQDYASAPHPEGMRSWTDTPGHLSKETRELSLFIACSGHAEFGVTGGDGNRVVQNISVNGQTAILWHEYNDTVVGIEWDVPNVGWLQLESQQVANGQAAAQRLSDSEMLKIANSMPVLAP
jgi:hypothetical protein